MSHLAKFLRASTVYFVGQVSVKIVAVLMLPVFTAHLSPSDYGYFDVGSAVLSIATALIFVEIATAFLRFGLGSYPSQRLDSIVTCVFVVGMLAAVVYVGVGVGVGVALRLPMWPAALAFGLSSAFSTIYGALSRVFGRNVVFMVSGVASAFVSAACNILFILFLRLGPVSLFLAGSIGGLTQIAIIELAVGGARRVKFRLVDTQLIRSMLRFSMPMVANSIALWCGTGLLRIIVAQTLGTAANGYIAIADRFLVGLSLFATVSALAWQESAFSLVADGDRGAKYSFALDLYMRALGGSLCVMIPLSFVAFPYLVAAQFDRVRVILPVYFMVILLDSVSGFLETVLFAEFQAKSLFYSTALNALVRVTLLLMFLPYLGLWAFIIASLLGSGLMTVMRYLITVRLGVAIRIDLRLLLLLSLGYVFVCFVYFTGNVVVNLATLGATLVALAFLLRKLLARVHSMFRAVRSGE